MNNRKGRFVISKELLFRNPEAVRALMGRCIVVRCEMMYASDMLEYTALSPDFDETPDGLVAHEYEVYESGQRLQFKRARDPEVKGAVKTAYDKLRS